MVRSVRLQARARATRNRRRGRFIPARRAGSGYVPDILYTAESEDERFSFMIQAGLEPDDDRPGYMRRTNPVVYSLLIMDDVGEAGSSSDHATIEDAKGARRGRDGDQRP